MKYILLLNFIYFSCAHKRIELDDLNELEVSDSKCSSAYQVNKDRPKDRILRMTSTTLTSSGSYMATGLGYIGDAAVYLVGGIGAGLVVCSPLIMIDVGLRGNGQLAGDCIGHVGGKVINSYKGRGMGSNIYKGTESWRCSNVDHISRGLREVAKCYLKKGEISHSFQQLDAILNHEQMSLCLSNNEKERIKIEREILKLLI